MTNSISKTNIIILALIYKYLTTKETKIKIADVEKFWLYININLREKNNLDLISPDKLENQYIYHQDNTYTNYVLIDPTIIEDIYIGYIDTIPQSILLESLNQEILNIINVDRKKIITKTYTKHIEKTIELYSISKNRAIESAIKHLTNSGYKNIQASTAFYLGMQPDHLWSVPVSYDEDITYIDLPNKDRIYPYPENLAFYKKIRHKTYQKEYIKKGCKND